MHGGIAYTIIDVMCSMHGFGTFVRNAVCLLVHVVVCSWDAGYMYLTRKWHAGGVLKPFNYMHHTCMYHAWFNIMKMHACRYPITCMLHVQHYNSPKFMSS